MTQNHRNLHTSVYASPRQPQGDFGRGSDHAQLGSSDDVNRELNKRGAYRDAEPEGTGRAPSQVPRPQRAEPLQPDRPGQGNERAEDNRDPAQKSEDAASKSRKQSNDALENVRDGYGR